MLALALFEAALSLTSRIATTYSQAEIPQLASVQAEIPQPSSVQVKIPQLASVQAESPLLASVSAVLSTIDHSTDR